MNWLDFVLIAVIVVSALVGLKIGLIGAAFTVAGAFVGWLLAGQFADDVGALFSDSLSNDTLVTVVSYAIIILGSLIVASIARKIVLPILNIATLGLTALVNRAGGIALGLVIGAALMFVLVIGLARLTYDFDLESVVEESVAPNVPAQVAGQVTQQVAAYADQVDKSREGLETALTESTIVPVVISVVDAIPANTLGFVPEDFKFALDVLDEKIQ